MASPLPAPALDLSTEVERPTIKIDHLPYELRVANDFAVMELREMDRMLPRVEALGLTFEAGEATDDECREFSALLSRLCELVVLAPAEVLAKLGDINKLLIYKVFIELLPNSLQRARAFLEANRAPVRTIASSGGKRSPLSNASIVPPTRRSGSRRSR